MRQLQKLCEWVRHHRLVVAIVIAVGTGLTAYGARIVDAIATRLFPPDWIAERVVPSRPNPRVETGSVKPAPSSTDKYTKCLEDRHVEQMKTRRQIEAARADLQKCTSAYKESAFWRRDREADALAYCSEFHRIVIANEAAAKAVESWTCRRPK